MERDGKRDLVPMRWGLVPWWWKKKAKETPATFNARAETVASKPMFRDAFKRKRCLIPASGYYEWQATPTGKQPYYFTARDGSPLTIAGLWDEWKDSETGLPLMSCTMIITGANELASKIHDRMPVLLQPKDFAALAGWECWDRVAQASTGRLPADMDGVAAGEQLAGAERRSDAH